MAKKRIIFLAIAVLCGFTPWFSLPHKAPKAMTWLTHVFLTSFSDILGQNLTVLNDL